MKKPKLIEYTAPDGHPWKAEAGNRLVEQFAMQESELPEWHAFMAGQSGAAWQFLRMLYGVNPVLPSVDGNSEVARLFAPSEIMASRGWKKPTFKEYLAALVDLWHGRPAPGVESPVGPPLAPIPAPPVAPMPPAPALPPPMLSTDDLATIQGFGFSPRVFELEDRDEVQKGSEIQWLAARLRDLKKMFEEPMAMGLARQAIINEMLLRRCDDQMTRISPIKKEFAAIQSTKVEIEKVYQTQWEQLEDICPFIKAITNKVSFSASLSDVIDSLRAWLATGDSVKIDGLFNWYAIQILTRASVQNPVIIYRLGWVLSRLEAKQGLWDPNFKPSLPNYLLAIYDQAPQLIYERLVEEGKVKLPDLELEGPAGEYSPLVEMPPELMPEEIIIPDEPIKME